MITAELTLENIECLLKDKPNNHRFCKVFKNNEILCTFEFDESNNIISIRNDEQEASYIYTKSGVMASEIINFENNEKMESYYKLYRNGTIFSEYIARTSADGNTAIWSGIKYDFREKSNKYLAKYYLDKLKSIYYRGDVYSVKYLNNGFEVLFDNTVPVYRELYDEKDRLIESYIVDYNCITNTFKYDKHTGKIIEQRLYNNRNFLAKIKYEYYEDSGCSLKREIIFYRGSQFELYYYYHTKGEIARIETNYDIYDFLYGNA